MRVAFALTTAAAAALLAAPAAHARADVGVRVAECRTAPAQADRHASFEGRMKTVRGAERLQMRFTLQARSSRRQRWRRVDAPGFNDWATSEQGVDRYTYVKKVGNLLAPGFYRVTVRYRWLDGAGDAIRRARAVSRACRQPDLRPNLKPLGIAIVPGTQAGAVRFTIRIRNAGASPAAATQLSLAVDGQALAAEVVPPLRAFDTQAVPVAGPRCRPGGTVAVTVDSTGAVEERNEADNVLSVPCPGAG